MLAVLLTVERYIFNILRRKNEFLRSNSNLLFIQIHPSKLLMKKTLLTVFVLDKCLILLELEGVDNMFEKSDAAFHKHLKHG